MNIWADVGQHLWTFFVLLVRSYLKLEGDIPLLGPTAMSSIESGHLSNLKWVYLSWIRAYLPRQSRLKDVLGLWISNANRLSSWPPTTTNQFSCFPLEVCPRTHCWLHDFDRSAALHQDRVGESAFSVALNGIWICHDISRLFYSHWVCRISRKVARTIVKLHSTLQNDADKPGAKFEFDRRVQASPGVV